MEYQPRVEQVAPVTTAVVRRRARQDELSAVVPQACGEVWAFVRSGLWPLRLEYAEGPAELERRNIAGRLLRLGPLSAILWALNAYPYAGLSLFARKR